MAGFYVYSDKNDIAAELVGFARQNGKPVSVLAFTEDAAAELAATGADRVCLIKGASPLPENYARALAAFLTDQGAELLLVGATARGRDLAARVAGYLDCGMASDVFSLSYADGQVSCERMTYGGAVVQSEILSGFSVLTVPAGKFAPAQGSAEIAAVELEADSRVGLVERAPIRREGADLHSAESIVCVGMGLEKEEDLQLARELAAVLGAEIGCTRGIAEERHWLPAEQYIGISGAMVKPRLYLSMGVSGQVQHVVGIRDAKLIVAIDCNEKAPIFRAADYGIVGDLYQVIPLLTQELKKICG